MIGPSTNVGRSLDGVRNKIGSARKKLVESQIVVICWLKSGFKSKRQGNASPMSQAGPGKRATNLDSVRAGEESASQYRGSKSDDERQTADPESQKTPDIDVKPQDPINFDGPAAQELLSDKAFLETLQKCISQDRKLRKTETKVDHRLTLIHEDLASFARRIQFLEDKIVDIEDNGSESEQLELPALYAKLDERRKEHAKATRERDRLDRKLETSWREQRVDVNRFLSTFEDALITDKLMPPKKTQSFISDLGALSTLSGASESVKSQSRRASEHSFRISLASTADLTPSQLEIRKEKDLLKEYAAACMIIRHDTHAFDSREDYIDNRIAERREKIAAGEEVVPQLEFDLELFQMGRDLTQRFAAAEARWEGAKAALIAAGVPVPGSMVSSGFVDNSGDRLSVDEIGSNS